MNTLDKLINDLVNFAIANRRGKKVFKDWSAQQLESEFKDALLTNCLLYSVGTNNAIDGVVHGTRQGNIIHVKNILTTHSNALKNFFIRFQQIYPGFKLTANRRGRLVEYNLSSFKRHLL